MFGSPSRSRRRFSWVPCPGAVPPPSSGRGGLRSGRPDAQLCGVLRGDGTLRRRVADPRGVGDAGVPADHRLAHSRLHRHGHPPQRGGSLRAPDFRGPRLGGCPRVLRAGFRPPGSRMGRPADRRVRCPAAHATARGPGQVAVGPGGTNAPGGGTKGGRPLGNLRHAYPRPPAGRPRSDAEKKAGRTRPAWSTARRAPHARGV